jgi:hypothetical protein
MDAPDGPSSDAVDWASLDFSQINDPEILKSLLQQAQASLEGVIKEAEVTIRGVPEQINFGDEDGGTTADHRPALLFTEEEFAALLQREQALRTNAKTQQAYTEAERSFDTDWMEVTDALQRKILVEAGVSEQEIETALADFRAAPYHYPALKQIPIYHRYQRSRQGPLKEGDPIPANLNLIDLTSHCSVDFTAMASSGLPVVVLAGS